MCIGTRDSYCNCFVNHVLCKNNFKVNHCTEYLNCSHCTLLKSDQSVNCLQMEGVVLSTTTKFGSKAHFAVTKMIFKLLRRNFKSYIKWWLAMTPPSLSSTEMWFFFPQKWYFTWNKIYFNGSQFWMTDVHTLPKCQFTPRKPCN